MDDKSYLRKEFLVCSFEGIYNVYKKVIDRIQSLFLWYNMQNKEESQEPKYILDSPLLMLQKV